MKINDKGTQFARWLINNNFPFLNPEMGKQFLEISKNLQVQSKQLTDEDLKKSAQVYADALQTVALVIGIQHSVLDNIRSEREKSPPKH